MKLKQNDSDNEEDDGWSEPGANGIASTDSIAKGVFVFKKKSGCPPSPTKKPIKSQQSNQVDSFAFFGLEKNALSTFRRDRYQAYQNLSLKVSQIMGEHQAEIFGKLLSDVNSYAREAASTRESTCSSGVIPTCVLFTGVNMPDHGDLFGLLKQHLVCDISPHVATIKSTSCPNLRSLVMLTMAQLMKKDSRSTKAEDHDDITMDLYENEDEVEGEVINVSRQRTYLGSFPRLKTWYDNQYLSTINNASHKKSSKKAAMTNGPTADQHHPQLIIVLEDFEGFPAQMLQNFILNLSMHSADLPFLLVLGVATTIDAVHIALPHSITSRLKFHKLAADPSIIILDKFFRTVVMADDIPFKLGGKVLQIVFEMFAFCDLSIKNVLRAFKWCLLEHYSSVPQSSLCIAEGSKRSKMILKKFSEDDLKSFMKLKSFKKLVESDPSRYISLLQNIDLFRHFLLQKIEILRQKTETFNIFVCALHTLAQNLPRDVLGQYFYSVYCSCISEQEPVTHSPEYRKIFDFLNLSESADLIKRLTAFVNFLKGYCDKNEEAAITLAKGEKLLDKLINFVESKTSFRSPKKPIANISALVTSSPSKHAILKTPTKEQLIAKTQEKAKVKLNFEGSSPSKQPRLSPVIDQIKVLDFDDGSFSQSQSSPRKTCKPDSPSTPISATQQTKLNRFQYREKLLQDVMSDSKREKTANINPYVELRQKIVTFLHGVFNRHLGSGATSCIPSLHVFYEVQYFDQMDLLNKHLIGNPSDAIQMALQDPYVYLENLNLQVDAIDEILPSMPDICIAFKLHLECQRYINLYDWFQCWLSIVVQNPETESKRAEFPTKKKKGKNGTKEDDSMPMDLHKMVTGDVDSQLLARFSQAVSELQFLGFIRPSKRKTDHVERLGFNT